MLAHPPSLSHPLWPSHAWSRRLTKVATSHRQGHAGYVAGFVGGEEEDRADLFAAQGQAETDQHTEGEQAEQHVAGGPVRPG